MSTKPLTVAEIEAEFDKKFEHSETCDSNKFAEQNETLCICKMKGIKQFFSNQITSLILGLRGEEVPEGQTKFCKNVLEMNYLIGLNKGKNEATRLHNQRIDESLGKEGV